MKRNQSDGSLKLMKLVEAFSFHQVEKEIEEKLAAAAAAAEEGESLPQKVKDQDCKWRS